MDSVLTFILNFIIDQSVTLIFFGAGIILGLISAFAAFTFFSVSEGKSIEKTPVKPVDDIIRKATIDFEAGSAGGNYDKKLRTLAAVSSRTANQVFKIYYGDDCKLVEVIRKNSYFPDGFSVPLTFTLYELVDFYARILTNLQTVVEDVMDKKSIRLLYGVTRSFSKFDKDPKDLRVSTVIARFFNNNNDEPTEEKKEGIVKTFLKNKAVGALVKFTSGYADDAFVHAIGEITYSVGLLCSHSLTEDSDRARNEVTAV